MNRDPLNDFLWDLPDPDDEPVTGARAALFVLVIAVLALVLLYLFATPASASWGPSGCSAQVAVATVEWPGWFKAVDGQWYKRGNGGVVERWDERTGRYEYWLAGRWVDDGARWRFDPVRGWLRIDQSVMTGHPELAGQPVQNFGVYLGKGILSAAYTINGLPVSRQAAREAVEAPWPDESNKEHWTVVGPPDWTKVVSDELRAVAGDRAIVKTYLASNWVVKDRLHLDESEEFKKSGKAVVVQDVDGTALHIQYAWNSGDAQVIGDGGFKSIPNLVAEHQGLLKSHDDLKKALAEAQAQMNSILKEVKESTSAVSKQIGEAITFMGQKVEESSKSMAQVQAQIAELKSILPNQKDLERDLESLKNAVSVVVWIDHNHETILIIVVLAVVGTFYYLKKE